MNFTDIPKLPFASYSVDIDWDYLESWLDKKQHEPYSIEIEPDFQRYHVWNDNQRTSYIEWILRGGFSGRDIFWNCAGWQDNYEGPLQLVDGLQRLTAVRMFLKDEVKAFGYFRSEFKGRMRMMDCRFKFHINNLKTRKEVLEWYLSINTGGVVHTKQEIDKVRKMLK